MEGKDSIELFLVNNPEFGKDLMVDKGEKIETIFVLDGLSASKEAKKNGISLLEEYSYIVKNIVSVNIYCKEKSCYKVKIKKRLNLKV